MTLSLVSSSALLTTGDDDHLLPKLVHAINRATEIEIAVSFIQPSGLALLLPSLREAIERHENTQNPLVLKILTSDYLHITHPVALRALLELEGSGVEIKIFETTQRSFHLKSYIFVRNDAENFQGTAFIGSNNISKTALTDAYEWSLRFDYRAPDNSKQAKEFHRIREKFNDIFTHPSAKILTDDWLNHYIRIRQKPCIASLPIAQIYEEQQYVPNSAQEMALAALNESRMKGFKRGLVVLATGMGKTWLAAFDAKQINAKRILFVAHREEILRQALNTFAKLWVEKTSAIFDGKTKNKDIASSKEMVFASVQTLGKQSQLSRFKPDDFDYVIIDEFHHANAKTYRNVLDYFSPKFLLGLTATPERSDQANILTLCHDNLVFERNLVHGIEANILVPFHYHGIWDETVNYQHIPWRNGKFDPFALDAEFMTQKRAVHVFKHWQKLKQSATLAFCVSQKHADFMAKAFNQAFEHQGFKAAAVHSESTLRRNEALEQLEKQQINVLFCVDLFNEGTDLPFVDTILMLRPTESAIIFLQQLGRGLRLNPPNKTHLVVLDFIGNHSSFLNKQQTLLSHSTKARQSTNKTPILPNGCSVNVDLAVLDFWNKLKQQYRNTAIEDYQALYAHLGHAPNAVEFYQAGYSLDKVNKQHASWWQMLASINEDTHLKRVVAKYHAFLFFAVQQTTMTKSFKMILLEAFIALGGIRKPVTLTELAVKSWHILARYPNIREKDLGVENQMLTADSKQWLRYWLNNPIKHSLTQSAREPQTWFVEAKAKEQKFFKLNLDVENEDIELLESLIQELIDLRLAQYVNRLKRKASKALNQPQSA